jgi:hypothetical protein
MAGSIRRVFVLSTLPLAITSLRLSPQSFLVILPIASPLIGFGLDSIVESLSGLVLVWRLRQHGKLSAAAEERLERRAIRFVAITFFILGVYVLFHTIRKLVLEEISEPSLPGIMIATASIIIMPMLMWQKHKAGKQIGSRALVADAKETLACAFLFLALLLGLGANYLLGF